MAKKSKKISNGVNEFLLETLREEGRRLKIPPHKNRALIREYLQTKIIYYLYELPSAGNLSFIGGTSLRILRELDRFSEDLDFDNLGLSFPAINKLFAEIKNKLEKEGFEIEYQMKKTDNSGIGEMKFKNLLFQIKISSYEKKNLVIRINYTTPRKKSETETLILSRFGLAQSVVTNTAEFLFSQKIRAIFTRKDLQPRDFYDVVWFLSHRIKPSPKLFFELGIKNEKELFLRINQVYQKKVLPEINQFKKRLSPFLIDEKKTSYLDLFGNLISSLAK